MKPLFQSAKAQALACFLVSAAVLIAAPSELKAAQLEHILIIGCDGFGSVGITPSNTPVLHQLMHEGSYTLRARGVMPTSSSPNWASIIMGAGPEQHGVTSNEWETNKFEISPVAVGMGRIFPTIFGVLREQRPKAYIACVHDWDGFGRLLEPAAMDLLENVKGSTNTARRAAQVIVEHKPTFLFVHFDEVDHFGHEFGWKTPQYYQAVEEVDRLIGSLLNALQDAGIRQQTVVIMTADHGGKGKSHGEPTMDEIQIPIIMAGPGIRPAHEITGAVNTYDTASTVAKLFGLKAPQAWIGKPITEALQ